MLAIVQVSFLRSGLRARRIVPGPPQTGAIQEVEDSCASLVLRYRSIERFPARTRCDVKGRLCPMPRQTSWRANPHVLRLRSTLFCLDAGTDSKT